MMNKSAKMKEWADKVKTRDGRCVECGTVEDLHAHHIKPKSSHPELSLELGNGKTLCYRCHKAEHERNRPMRIRSNKPRRSTLEARVRQLEKMVQELEGEIAKERKMKMYERTGKIMRGDKA
jgi:predicted RNase H-like nuclease (RuvC/YqgF family)